MMALRRVLLLLWLTTLAFVVQGQDPVIRLWEDTPVRARSVTLVPYLTQTRSKRPSPNPSHKGGETSGLREEATGNESIPSRGDLEGSSEVYVRGGSPAIIICPGGSYFWHDYNAEGKRVAEWLQREGIAAFVLKYRVQGIGSYVFHTSLFSRSHQHPNAICDVQRAIQYIREHATEFDINPHRLGVMGFSAGGHLSMSAAAYSRTDFLAPLGISHSVNLRPDFVAPIYPVVTMHEPYVHKRSRRALLGERRKHWKAMCDSLSVECHIPADCPPVFLLNCTDDPVVKSQNSELLDSALTAHDIPHTYIKYMRGGHGFGAAPKRFSNETMHWQEAFIKWLKQSL